jgi:hypothetical protein
MRFMPKILIESYNLGEELTNMFAVLHCSCFLVSGSPRNAANMLSVLQFSGFQSTLGSVPCLCSDQSQCEDQYQSHDFFINFINFRTFTILRVCLRYE